MTRILAALMLLAAPALLTAQSLDGRLKKIADSKSIAVAYRTDALPFAYEGDGKQPAGYTVEMCKRIVASLERQLKVQPLQVKWVPATTQNRFDLVSKGQADMECGSSTVTLSRMAQVDFSSYIFVDSTGVLVRTATNVKSFPELAGKRIAVVGGTTNEPALDAAVKKLKGGATVVKMKDRDEAVKALEGGTIDAFAGDKVVLHGLAAKVKDRMQYGVLDEDLSFEPYAIALPRGDANFRLAVNRGLAELFRSEDMVNIFRQAFGPAAVPTPMLLMIYGLGAYPN